MASRVVLAMSGGVDSSAAAVLLQREGYDVIGLFMRSGMSEPVVCHLDGQDSVATPVDLGHPKSHKQGCCSATDAADARRVANGLQIPFYALDFHEGFSRIVDYFADEYFSGRTPNPCIMCNNWLKFGKLWEFARQVDADFIATGHYAALQRSRDGSMPALVRGRDRSKDQSYVLFGIQRELLDRVLFPVGRFTKSEIRDLARQAGLQTAEKQDSQEICFVPDDDYVGFLHRHAKAQDTSGDIVDTDGNIVGHHDGFEAFTIGQRRGLGIAFGEPRYVVAIEAESHQVVVGHKEDLRKCHLEADRLNWLIDPPATSFSCLAQIRYRHAAAAATACIEADDRIRVSFAEAQTGIAPGQAVVLYDGERVLGGGRIITSEP